MVTFNPFAGFYSMFCHFVAYSSICSVNIIILGDPRIVPRGTTLLMDLQPVNQLA